MRISLACALALLLSVACVAQSQVYTTQRLFQGGVTSYGGHVYQAFRIPSIVRTKNGHLIAIVEGRMNGASDFGNINLLGRRSVNNGATWSPVFEVVGSGQGSWTNPTMVVDYARGTNGRVWIFFNWNSEVHTSLETIREWGDRRTYCSFSDDEGVTWTPRVNMTSILTPRHFAKDWVGPGIGIQTRFDNPGRLVVPAYLRNFYSDDGGEHWRYMMTRGSETNEATVVECMDGVLLRNDRASSESWNLSARRFISRGTMETQFQPYQPHPDLWCPKCEASILRYNIDSPHRMVFLNPRSTRQPQRWPMYARISYDDGATWPVDRMLVAPSDPDMGTLGGYSSMTKTADYCVGALVESTTLEPVSRLAISRSIEFIKFNLSWIVGS